MKVEFPPLSPAIDYNFNWKERCLAVEQENAQLRAQLIACKTELGIAQGELKGWDRYLELTEKREKERKTARKKLIV